MNLDKLQILNLNHSHFCPRWYVIQTGWGGFSSVAAQNTRWTAKVLSGAVKLESPFFAIFTQICFNYATLAFVKTRSVYAEATYQAILLSPSRVVGLSNFCQFGRVLISKQMKEGHRINLTFPKIRYWSSRWSSQLRSETLDGGRNWHLI